MIGNLEALFLGVLAPISVKETIIQEEGKNGIRVRDA
jgi:hypothetical protein